LRGGGGGRRGREGEVREGGSRRNGKEAAEIAAAGHGKTTY
jgi:hypothetical protein